MNLMPVTSTEADLYLENDTVFKVYRSGIEPCNIKVEHKNLIKLNNEANKNERIVQSMPYYKLGTLKDYIGKLSKEQIDSVYEQCIAGISALHEAGYMHGDLKPENIFVESLDPISIKIADFGSSSMFEHTNLTCIRGTIQYMAPEKALGVSHKNSDLWSIGVILHEMLTGEPPKIENLMHLASGKISIDDKIKSDPRIMSLLAFDYKTRSSLVKANNNLTKFNIRWEDIAVSYLHTALFSILAVFFCSITYFVFSDGMSSFLDIMYLHRKLLFIAFHIFVALSYFLMPTLSSKPASSS